MIRSRALTTTAVTLLTTLATVATAQAAARLYIRGAGFGHGVGMSQYGAYGFALQGQPYRFILEHYYTGTEIARAEPGRAVRVLVRSHSAAAAFRGATLAGERKLEPDRTYRAVRRGSAQVDLLDATGKLLDTVVAPLSVRGGAEPLTLHGVGRYRGAFEFRPGAFTGLDTINAVGLEQYVRGVISAEMPAAWPAEALKAQAVAARTYAITSDKPGAGFEHYADTRSQVYRGVAAERASTDAAVAATRGQVVAYGGRPVTTYFFSTSGGRTENVEYAFLGAEPLNWLRSVEDPFDNVSPRHRWGPIGLTRDQAAAKLSGLVKGSFRSIKVLDRGRSPRIVAAEVIGTGGRTRVTGPELRRRFGLFDTWAYFTVISSKAKPPKPLPEGPGGGPQPQPPSPNGAATMPPAGAARATGLTGSVQPGRAGALIALQRLDGERWVAAARTRLRRGGRYRFAVRSGGAYRVLWRGLAGPVVRVG